jgi:hypothetical protein
MPSINAQVRPNFTYDTGAPVAVAPPAGFEGTFALTYDPSGGTAPGGLYTVVLYADKDASSAQLVFTGDGAILVDVPAGFQQSELRDVINAWRVARGGGGGSGGGAPGSVKTNP